MINYFQNMFRTLCFVLLRYIQRSFYLKIFFTAKGLLYTLTRQFQKKKNVTHTTIEATKLKINKQHKNVETC